MQIFAVGGSVRDQLMGRTPKDHDYVVVGATEQMMLDQGYERVGQSFPVFLKNGCEYALARTEKKDGVGYNGFSVDTAGVSLEEDLLRRDLTINAMAHPVGVPFDVNKIIDPYGGIKDVERKILKHTSEAFAEDPLRILRVARFAARYSGFVIHQTTYALMERIAPELKNIHASRIVVELEKGFSETTPSNMLNVLDAVEAQKHHQLLQMFGADLENPFQPPIDWLNDPSLSIEQRAGGVMVRVTKAFNDVIPSSWLQVNHDLIHYSKTLKHYSQSLPTERVRLIDQIKGLHSDARIKAMYGLMRAMKQTTCDPNLILTDIEKIKQIDMASALVGVEPKNIAATVLKLKINALS